MGNVALGNRSSHNYIVSRCVRASCCFIIAVVFFQISQLHIVAYAAETSSQGSAVVEFATPALSRVILTGNTVYIDSELVVDYKDSVGKRLTTHLANEIAKRLTKKYRSDGFIFSHVQLPKEGWLADDGTLLLQSVEKTAHDVRIVGSIKDRPELFESFKSKILASKPFNENDLDRYMLLANDLPGVKAWKFYQPVVETPGATDVVINVREEATWDAFVSAGNRGSSTIGQYVTSLGANFSSFLGQYERIGVSFSTTEKLSALQAGSGYYTSVLNSEGTTATLAGTISNAQPEGNLKDAEIKSGRNEYSLTLQHPVIRSQFSDLLVRGSFVYRDYETKMLNQLASEDRLRIARVGLTYSDRKRWQDGSEPQDFGYKVDVEASRGLEILNNTEYGYALNSRTGGHPDFTKVNGEIDIWRKFNEKWLVSFRTQGQLSKNRLLASEQFGYGGGEFGRAFDASEITGDHGVAASVELQYDLLKSIFGSSASDSEYDSIQSHLRQLSPYVFYDIGATYGAGREASDTQKTGSSVGLGVRWKITDYVSGFGEAAKPLMRSVSSEDDGRALRFFFGVRAQY